MAEPCKFENILLNLIVHAREAMPKGGDIVLETAAERVESQLTDGHWTVPPGDYVTVLVRDTGHGISKHIMERVLERFFTTKPVGKGTGLGLTSLRDSMQAWRSHVMITSARELGTSVKMYLTPASQEDAASLKEDLSAMTAGSNGETILLVEYAADTRSAVSDQRIAPAWPTRHQSGRDPTKGPASTTSTQAPPER